jgi:YidC/Oxa1 family membrane protein insertase
MNDSSTADTIDSATSVLDATISDAIPVPLHYGDLAMHGLAGWSPDGIFQWLLESIQVTTGMPWAYAVIASIISWRLVMIPLTTGILQKTSRVAGRPAPDFRSYPQDQKQYRSYCLEMVRAVKSGDNATEELVRSKINAIFPADYDLLAWRIFVHAFSLSSLLGIVRLFALPLEQLKHGGGFIPDLTIATNVADPYFVFPSMFVVLGLSWIRVGIAIHRLIKHILVRFRRAKFLGNPVS